MSLYWLLFSNRFKHCVSPPLHFPCFWLCCRAQRVHCSDPECCLSRGICSAFNFKQMWGQSICFIFLFASPQIVFISSIFCFQHVKQYNPVCDPRALPFADWVYGIILVWWPETCSIIREYIVNNYRTNLVPKWFQSCKGKWGGGCVQNCRYFKILNSKKCPINILSRFLTFVDQEVFLCVFVIASISFFFPSCRHSAFVFNRREGFAWILPS